MLTSPGRWWWGPNMRWPHPSSGQPHVRHNERPQDAGGATHLPSPGGDGLAQQCGPSFPRDCLDDHHTHLDCLLNLFLCLSLCLFKVWQVLCVWWKIQGQLCHIHLVQNHRARAPALVHGQGIWWETWCVTLGIVHLPDGHVLPVQSEGAHGHGELWKVHRHLGGCAWTRKEGLDTVVCCAIHVGLRCR